MNYTITLPDRITPATFNANSVEHRGHLMEAFAKAKPVIPVKITLGAAYKEVNDGAGVISVKCDAAELWAMEKI